MVATSQIRIPIFHVLQEILIKEAFVDNLNEKFANKEEILDNLRAIRNLLSGGENTLQQQTALWQESQLLEEQIQALIMQNARIAMDQHGRPCGGA